MGRLENCLFEKISPLRPKGAPVEMTKSVFFNFISNFFLYNTDQ